ncbi:hypothetical protein Cni_G02477 [Canna indica]|uniref:Uncharacterized protein n=1 Tax=Canna indica TaxID=4628 RepID=A0AAQ3JS60_9LILI|nr:hypothetical protein Cni_G02477 [Canna indica]
MLHEARQPSPAILVTHILAFTNDYKGSIGFVVRDSAGRCFLDKGKTCAGQSALEREAKAIKWAMKNAVENNF